MKIFISYAREDHPIALELYRRLLEIPELSPWLDTEYLLPGSNWRETILKEIEESRIIITLLSNNSVKKSGFVQKEMYEALEKLSNFPPNTICVIPARVEECTPSHRILLDIQYVDLFPSVERGIDQIVAAIEAIREKEQAPEAILTKELVEDPDKVEVKVLRVPSKDDYNASKFRLFCDGEKVGELGVGDLVEFTTTPGRHRFFVEYTYTYSMNPRSSMRNYDTVSREFELSLHKWFSFLKCGFLREKKGFFRRVRKLYLKEAE